MLYFLMNENCEVLLTSQFLFDKILFCGILVNRSKGEIMKMKTIGLIGGMSWESTVSYYKIVNEVVKKELGGLHSAKCFLYSVDFQEIDTTVGES